MAKKIVQKIFNQNRYIMARACFFASVFFVNALCIFAQSATPSSASLEPSVKDISLLVTDMTVQITWKRAQNKPYSPSLSYRIYRDTKPLTRQTISLETLVSEQDSSQLIFSEILPDTNNYYYAVLASDSHGLVDELVIAGVNATMQPASGHPAHFLQKESSNITNIRTVRIENCVIITYNAQKVGNSLLLYRDTVPFTSSDSLASARLVARTNDDATPLTDTPYANTPFYYALIEEDALQNGSVEFIAGKNTTEKAIMVPFTITNNVNLQTSSMRKTPLPSALSSEIEENTKDLETLFADLIDTVQAQNSTQKNKVSLANTLEQGTLPGTLQESAQGQNALSPQIHADDLTEETDGGAILKGIVQNSFVAYNFLEAERALKDYLLEPEGAYTKARANWYLGQICYFTGRKRDALLYFLEARNLYYNDSAVWIDAILHE